MILKNFYQEYYTAQNGVLSIVGNITQAQAEQLANKISMTLPQGKLAPKLPPVQMIEKPITKNINFKASQTNIIYGQLGITYQDPELFALRVGNYILGGGSLVSRLFKIVRDKEGLTYSIYSTFSPMAETGPFIINFSTKKASTDKAINLTESLLKQFLQSGPTEQELNSAKKYLIGSYPLRYDSNADIADALIYLGIYNLPKDYFKTYTKKIKAVTINDINKAFKKHIKPNKMVLISVGQKNSNG